MHGHVLCYPTVHSWLGVFMCRFESIAGVDLCRSGHLARDFMDAAAQRCTLFFRASLTHSPRRQAIGCFAAFLELVDIIPPGHLASSGYDRPANDRPRRCETAWAHLQSFFEVFRRKDNADGQYPDPISDKISLTSLEIAVAEDTEYIHCAIADAFLVTFRP
mmetsp:Transcript_33904/g.97571  ORF Transcript_33904/g.97571 Transcript_33904/m.97571 type:complete len:162 (-) Transcript_33904:4-489(-)